MSKEDSHMKRISLAVAAAALLHFAPAHAQTPSALGAGVFSLGITSQTNGASAGITSSHQEASGRANVDFSTGANGAFNINTARGYAAQAGESKGYSNGLGASGSSASIQGATALGVANGAAFPQAAFSDFAGFGFK